MAAPTVRSSNPSSAVHHRGVDARSETEQISLRALRGLHGYGGATRSGSLSIRVLTTLREPEVALRPLQPHTTPPTPTTPRSALAPTEWAFVALSGPIGPLRKAPRRTRS